MHNAISQMQAAGLLIDGAVEFGRIVRCMVGGDKGRKKSGWYVLHEFRLDSGEVVVVGRYGNWKLFGDQSMKIEFAGTLSRDDLEKAKQASDAIRARVREERAELAKQAADRSAAIWPKLPEYGKSEYLIRKRVGAHGVKFTRGSIVVPVRNIEGALTGLQFIQADGTKKFLTGTPVRGCFHRIGQLVPGKPLAVAEGYATAATIHQVMGWPVAVAFNANNLEPVAVALRQRYPDQRMIICGDNDANTPGNPGVEQARKAAKAVDARLAIPDFSYLNEVAA